MSWTGERFLGGWGAGGPPARVTTHGLSLGHGSIVQGPGRRTLVVETATPDWRGADGTLIHFADVLWHGDAATPEDAMALYREESMESGAPHELTPLPMRGGADVLIDDAVVAFDVVLGIGVWAGRATVRSHVVTVHGRGFDVEGLSLLRIADLTPYIDGTRRFEVSRG